MTLVDKFYLCYHEQMLHHIRRAVLDQLATAETLRYGELKPSGLDGNVFTYHLKGVIADGLVQKSEHGDYSLTQLGREYIVRRYEHPTESAHCIYLMMLKRGSTYLIRTRKVQPLLGWSGFIHGEPEAGVGILESATKRLFEKTGIHGARLAVVGSALISQYVQGELHSFSHAVIISGETEQDILISEDETGKNFWSELENVERLLPSCVDVKDMIDQKVSWLEGSYDLD